MSALGFIMAKEPICDLGCRLEVFSLHEEMMTAGLVSLGVSMVWWVTLKLLRHRGPYPYLFQIFAGLGGVTAAILVSSLAIAATGL